MVRDQNMPAIYKLHLTYVMHQNNAKLHLQYVMHQNNAKLHLQYVMHQNNVSLHISYTLVPCLHVRLGKVHKQANKVYFLTKKYH